MALASPGSSTCSICDQVLSEEDFDDDRVACTTHFIRFPDHHLWAHSDACMHKECFLKWPHNEEFAALCMLMCGHDHLLKLLGLSKTPQEILDWDSTQHSYFGLLEWDVALDAWTCSFQHEATHLRMYLPSDARHRQFPFDTAALTVQRLLRRLQQLRERVEIKANEIVVVSESEFESNEPLHIPNSQWIAVRLSEAWIDWSGGCELWYASKQLPERRFLVAIVDPSGQVTGVETRTRPKVEAQ